MVRGGAKWLATGLGVTVAAYAAPTAQVRHVQPRRAEGMTSATTPAAMPERHAATSRAPPTPVKSVPLMAAPPVENNAAAPITWSRARPPARMCAPFPRGASRRT